MTVNQEGKYQCPVPSCSQGEEGQGNLQRHGGYWHSANKVVVGGECLPRY